MCLSCNKTGWMWISEIACTYGLEEIIAYLAHTAMTHPADGRRGERWFCTHAPSNCNPACFHYRAAVSSLYTPHWTNPIESHLLFWDQSTHAPPLQPTSLVHLWRRDTRCMENCRASTKTTYSTNKYTADGILVWICVYKFHSQPLQLVATYSCTLVRQCCANFRSSENAANLCIIVLYISVLIVYPTLIAHSVHACDHVCMNQP